MNNRAIDNQWVANLPIPIKNTDFIFDYIKK